MARIDNRLLLKLSIAFFCTAIIGTISHEVGHYLVAKHFGYSARLSYASTSYIPSTGTNYSSRHAFFITLGGPVLTISVGTISFLLMMALRKNYRNVSGLSIGKWTLVFLSLFWLRQTVNLAMSGIYYLIKGHYLPRGDEFKIAHYLGISLWTINFITGVIGIYVLVSIVFKFIPVMQRKTFSLAALIGGFSGYIFWIELFGKYIMP